MSVDNAKAFLERLKTDEKFRQKAGSAKDKKDRIKFVNEARFAFSREDLKKASHEMGEDELDLICGGTCVCITDCGVFDFISS